MFEKTDNDQKKYNNNEPDAKLRLSPNGVIIMKYLWITTGRNRKLYV